MKHYSSSKDNMANIITLSGYVGSEPRVYANVKGFLKTEFAFATHFRYKDREGRWVGNTTWHKIIAWGKIADAAQQFVHKGNKLEIKGQKIIRYYIDKLGNRREIHEISLLEFEKKETKMMKKNHERNEKTEADYGRASN